jgi:hypothetical protein
VDADGVALLPWRQGRDEFVVPFHTVERSRCRDKTVPRRGTAK